VTRIGIDVGGTFTDLVATDEGGAAAHDFKLLSIPDNPAAAIGMIEKRLYCRTYTGKYQGTIPSRKLFFNQDSLAIGRG